MRRVRTAAIIAIVLVAMLGLVGCQQMAEKAAETAIEKSTGVDVQKNGDNITIETSQGTASISGDAKLPDGFPTDVPVYQPSSVKAAVTDNSQGKENFLVNLETTDEKAKVFDWYKTELETQGWKTLNTVDTAQGAGGITAEKGTSTLLVAIADGTSGTGTNITLTVTPKQ